MARLALALLALAVNTLQCPVLPQGTLQITSVYENAGSFELCFWCLVCEAVPFHYVQVDKWPFYTIL